MVGRIETYVHSDNITQHKGAAIVKIECDTDFAARTEKFIEFSRLVAKWAYGSSATTWDDIVAVFPEMEETRTELAKTLKEKIEVAEIAILRL